MRKRKGKLSEGKKNIIADLIREYDIQSAEDIQDALKDLLGGIIESMLAAELDNHLDMMNMSVVIALMHEMEGSKSKYVVNMEK